LHLQAFPGVLIAMSSIAVLMRYSFPYGWSWTQALLFGAMMAATDPVATIAVLGSVSPLRFALHLRLVAAAVSVHAGNTLTSCSVRCAVRRIRATEGSD
jgi:NhaP-type Na+/H+ or K+/H+ antiporter